MRLCPKCDLRKRVRDHVEHDNKTGKKYLITSCVSCDFHFEIDELKNEISKQLQRRRSK